MTSPEFGLDGLRAWLGQRLIDARRVKADKAVTRSVEQMLISLGDRAPSLKAAECVRLLSAVGLAQCVRFGHRFRLGAVDRVLLEIGTLAIWPLIVTPRLPDQWQEPMAELTSPRFSEIVTRFRAAAGSGQTVSLDSLAETIGRRPFADAVLNLLQDFADPRRGRPTLVALGIVMRRPVPSRVGPRAALTWIVKSSGDVVGDIVEDTVEEIVDEGIELAVQALVDAIWNQTTPAVDNPSASDPLQSGRGASHHDHVVTGRSGGHHPASGLDDAIGQMFD